MTRVALGRFRTARLAFGAVFAAGAFAFACNVGALGARRPLSEFGARQA